MEDAIRPSEQAARGMYTRGYQTWFTIFERAAEETSLPRDCLQRLRADFPNQPWFPNNVAVDSVFDNAALVKGIISWRPADEPSDLPIFQEESIFNIAWDKPTRVVLTPDIRQARATLPDVLGEDSHHIPILLQAWAYILCARWAELVPGARIQFNGETNGSPSGTGKEAVTTINIGTVSRDASQWWKAILSVDSNWDATICNKKGQLLYSPWSTTLSSERPLLVLTKVETEASEPNTNTISSSAACRYLTDYCTNHGIDGEVSLAALAAALLIPAVKYDGRAIGIPIPEMAGDRRRGEDKRSEASSFEAPDPLQLDKLLTLSCNARGVKALLTSVFFEPGVESNICGMWLRGSFAFLSTIKDPNLLLRTMIKRNPELGFLWVGAFITGCHDRALREGRGGWWKIDLGAAAWTGTLMSFIQEPVLCPAPGTTSISRANECRLSFLCHGMGYTTTPLFPFAPFGSTALHDTNLDVREHLLCGRDHVISYVGLTWRCDDGTEIEQKPEVPSVVTRPNTGQLLRCSPEVDIDYNDYDSEDETSEMVTRNIFTWLRGEDGFPVAERAIREHEWIDNLDSDDDEPIEGDVRSTVGGCLHGWLLKTSTQRSNSI
ncbi:immunoglobulin variable region used by the itc63b heavy chain [Fusarium sporotrichioides]|uniref:Immunoglobulin variable region used by the itc63b heavy chain n=1 Tax=Fusarium sporotrichioides TaxID=5514 RepID=A0A395RLG5_FUSSP|nr:immunoglobulin variable region used by the itc63b heavy chain [Fusarium sporotrichioides]